MINTEKKHLKNGMMGAMSDWGRLCSFSHGRYLREGDKRLSWKLNKKELVLARLGEGLGRRQESPGARTELSLVKGRSQQGRNTVNLWEGGGYKGNRMASDFSYV